MGCWNNLMKCEHITQSLGLAWYNYEYPNAISGKQIDACVIPLRCYILVSFTIKVFLCGALRAYTSLPLQYFLSLHFSFAYVHMLSVKAGNRTLPHLGQKPQGFNWQSSTPVTGLAPVTVLFICVYGVTEIPATCNPPIFQLCPCVSQLWGEECTVWPCPFGQGSNCL